MSSPFCWHNYPLLVPSCLLGKERKEISSRQVKDIFFYFFRERDSEWEIEFYKMFWNNLIENVLPITFSGLVWPFHFLKWLYRAWERVREVPTRLLDVIVSIIRFGLFVCITYQYCYRICSETGYLKKINAIFVVRSDV